MIIRTINQILKEIYENEPNRIFCRFIKENKTEDITYKKLIEESFRYASHYKKLGLKKGDIVLVILKHSPHLFYSFIGAMLGGMIPSQMPFPSEKQHSHLYRDSLEMLVKRIKARAIVTYKENLYELGVISREHVSIFTPEDIKENPEIEWIDCCKEDIALLQHSSGTTGLKKGVALSHEAILNQLDDYSIVLHLEENDAIISWLPLYHDMGLIACLILPLLKKIPLVMMCPFEWVNNPSMLLEQIERNRATLCWLPNFAYNFLARNCSADYNLSSLRAVIDCSEPCKPHSFKLFYNKFKSAGLRIEALQTCYAMAENVFAVTQSEIGKEVRIDYVDREKFLHHHTAEQCTSGNVLAFLSVGRAIPNNEIEIVSDERKELKERHIGEIAIKSNCLFSGYFKLPKETAMVMENGWYYTGDMGYIANGELYITGRKKDIIIVHGKNYYAHDIEYLASHVHGVKAGRTVAVGVYSEETGSEEAVVIAETAVEDNEKREKISREIKRVMSEALNLLLGDVSLVPLKWLVKTTSGKISRKENRDKYLKEKSSQKNNS